VKKRGKYKKKERRSKRRVVSYVYFDDDDGNETSRKGSRERDIGDLGIHIAINYERLNGREPKDMNEEQENYPEI
jgi:hypothetical protein